jgi:hypothetical protein
MPEVKKPIKLMASFRYSYETFRQLNELMDTWHENQTNTLIRAIQIAHAYVKNHDRFEDNGPHGKAGRGT